jgi:hypothetical protein
MWILITILALMAAFLIIEFVRINQLEKKLDDFVTTYDLFIDDAFEDIKILREKAGFDL